MSPGAAQTSPAIPHAMAGSPATFGDHLGEAEIKCKPERKPHQIQLAKDEQTCRTRGQNPQKSSMQAK